MIIVVMYGIFDFFYIGYVRFLKWLYSLGDRLVVGLFFDEFNMVKGKNVVIFYEDRKEILFFCCYVDDVF